MELVLEILDRLGRVRERQRLASFPATIGRSYKSSVIIDDPYICAEHVKIELDEAGQALIRDCATVNGTWSRGARLSEQVLNGQLTFLIGNTSLRLVDPSIQVPRALLREKARGGVNGPAIALLYLFWCALEVGGYCYFTCTYRLTPERMLRLALIATLLPLIFFFVWAGIWSFASRLTSQRAHFAAHFSCIFLATWFLRWFTSASAYFQFAAGIPLLGGVIDSAAIAGTLFIVLNKHLRWTGLKRPAAARIAAAVTCCVAFVAIAVSHISYNEFSDEPPIKAQLKPPAFLLTEGESNESFFSRAVSLKQELSELADRPQ